MTPVVRLLAEDDREQVWGLNRLAFGGETRTGPPADTPVQDGLGLFDAGRLVGSLRLRAYHQWWGGRQVPMGGVAAVAVHPDARGRGTASRLLRAALSVLAERGAVVSALFPTTVALYRGLGWELVGSLDQTRLATGDLRQAGDPGAAVIRSAMSPADLVGLPELYARSGDGLVNRSGPEFPRGPVGLLEHDVVALAPGSTGVLEGYAVYDRGLGFGPSGELEVLEVIAGTQEAFAALVRSLGSWETVAPSVDWRGPTDELALLLPRPLPAPHRRRPWMLRMVDAPGAVAARGFLPSVAVEESFLLVDPVAERQVCGWHLTVREGAGCLSPAEAGPDLPRLHVRGLALLYAGAADSAMLVRAGLLDRRLPSLDAAFPGGRPRLLDYF